MGEVSTSLLEADVEVSGDTVDEVVHAAPKRRLARRTIAIAVVGALVIAGGVVGGVAWANQVAHDNAVIEAEAAHATAAHAAAAHRATLAWLETSVDAGIASRDAVDADVLGHQDLLGGADAVAPVAESRAELGALLADILGVDEPVAESVIPGAAPIGTAATVDPGLGTDELTALAAALVSDARAADTARSRLAGHAEDVDTAVKALGQSLDELTDSLPAVHQALLEGHTLASGDSTAVAATALAALTSARSDAALPALFATYVSAASGVVAAHDAEAARIAAEAARVAAEEAARKARASTRGGGSSAGGSSGGGSGVLGLTNARRAEQGLGALSSNGRLNSAACSWAAQLAAADAGLSHGPNPGGFGWWGENVASGYSSASSVVAGWMNSSGHRANILRPQFTLMGSCSADAASGTRYWVQQFGS